MRRSRVTYAKCSHCRQRVRSGAGSYCWACQTCRDHCHCAVAPPPVLLCFERRRAPRRAA
jgi:hypothetical protein